MLDVATETRESTMMGLVEEDQEISSVTPIKPELINMHLGSFIHDEVIRESVTHFNTKSRDDITEKDYPEIKHTPIKRVIDITVADPTTQQLISGERIVEELLDRTRLDIPEQFFELIEQRVMELYQETGKFYQPYVMPEVFLYGKAADQIPPGRPDALVFYLEDELDQLLTKLKGRMRRSPSTVAPIQNAGAYCDIVEFKTDTFIHDDEKATQNESNRIYIDPEHRKQLKNYFENFQLLITRHLPDLPPEITEPMLSNLRERTRLMLTQIKLPCVEKGSHDALSGLRMPGKAEVKWFEILKNGPVSTELQAA